MNITNFPKRRAGGALLRFALIALLAVGLNGCNVTMLGGAAISHLRLTPADGGPDGNGTITVETVGSSQPVIRVFLNDKTYTGNAVCANRSWSLATVEFDCSLHLRSGNDTLLCDYRNTVASNSSANRIGGSGIGQGHGKCRDGGGKTYAVQVSQ